MSHLNIEEVNQLFLNVAARVDAGETLFNTRAVSSTDDEDLCRLHTLTCGPCLERAGDVSQMVTGIKEWAGAIEALAEQARGAVETGKLLAAIAGLARAIGMAVEMEEDEMLGREQAEGLLKEIRAAASTANTPTPLGPRAVKETQ